MVFTSVWFTLGFNDAWLFQDIGDSVLLNIALVCKYVALMGH